MKKSKKDFFKIPEFPGGKEAFKKYIKENLKYPLEALNNRIEGIVHLIAEINDNGEIIDVVIERGIHKACDAEATRLIKNIHFGNVKNRGVRLKAKKRFRVEFKLPSPQKVSYNYVQNKEEVKEKGSKIGYQYIINFKK